MVTTLRVLTTLLLASSTMGAVACGSTISTEAGAEDGADGGGDDDGGDGGTPTCGDVPSSDCVGPVCVDGVWQCTGVATCPAAEPTSGGACAGDLSCRYGGATEECDPFARTYDCVAGTWSEARTDRCQPPFECPAARPEDGSPCAAPAGVVCEYGDGTECGYPPTYECIDGRWTNIESTFFRCSPPDCRFIVDPVECAEWDCRWLEPGCGDETIPALSAAGCFDPWPCDGACPLEGEVCTQTMVLPDCEDCDACGQSEMLCVAGTADAEP